HRSATDAFAAGRGDRDGHRPTYSGPTYSGPTYSGPMYSEPMYSGQPSLAAREAMADLRLAAWFLWITPLLTALSSWREAAWASSAAFAVSPASAASRNRRMCVRRADLMALLFARAFSFVLFRLIWDLMFATGKEPSRSSDSGFVLGPLLIELLR